MTYAPVIYDWPPEVAPVDQFFRAGGMSISGGMTLGGASNENPEPGGRGELMLSFPRFALPSTNLLASWALSKILNGNVIRVRLWTPSVQLVPDSDLGTGITGPTWSAGQTWANGLPWRANPSVDISGSAAKGASSLKCNMIALGRVLKIGHVIGLHLDGHDFTHIVTDISYSASDVATISIQPPLRRAAVTTNRVYFRPVMLATCANPREVADNFRWGQTTQFNPIRFVEALV